jgi:outer membrane receptor protein involved in Fe transport
MSKSYHSGSCLKILIAMSLPAWLAPPLFAQTDEGKIEEILVTAQKRPEDIQDVPISITTFNGEFMEDSNLHTLQDLSLFTPNLTLSHSSQVANNRIIMRGVGSVGDAAIEPSVAVFIDGVYYPRAGSVVGSLTDLEMVEVLRGPQGTLFGRNASMGMLNIRTAMPTEEMEGNLRVSYGDFDQMRVSGAISGGLLENTSGRLSFSYSDRDGYGENTFTTGQSADDVGEWRDLSLRGKLFITPTENLDITLTADYSSVDNGGGTIEVKTDSLLPTYLPTLSTILNPPLPTTPSPTYTFSPGGPTPDGADTFDYTINQDHRDLADDRQMGFSAEINLNVGEHTVRSITSIRDWENDTFESALRLPADLLNRRTGYDTQTISQEFQILSPTGGRFEYVAGAYYYDEDYSIDQNFNLGADFCSPAIGNMVGAGAIRTGSASVVAVAAGITPTIVSLTGMPAASAGTLAQTIVGGILRGLITSPAQLVSLGIPSAAAPTLLATIPAAAAALTTAQKAAAANGIANAAVTDCKTGAQPKAIDGDFSQGMQSFALFGQVTYHVNDRLRLTGGLRWTDDEKDGSFTQTLNNLILDAPAGSTFSTIGKAYSVNLRINESFPSLLFEDNELTWMGNISYYLTDEIMAFGTYSTGYKSGGFNSDGANRAIPRTFLSETVDNYELGVKSTLFDDRMVANMTLFRTDIDDFQDRQFDGVSFIVQNAGELRQQGFELDIQARPLPQLYSVFGLSWLDSEFLSFPNATALPYIIATTAAGSIPPGQDLGGRRNHFSPEWHVSLMAEWSDAIPNFTWSWFTRGEFSHISEQNIGAETNQNAQSLQEGYSLLGFHAGVRSQDEKWEIAFSLKNATDEGYCQTIFNQPIGTTLGLVDPVTLGGMQRCVLGTPRTWGVEVGYSF